MNFNELVEANKQNVKNIIRLITKQDNEDLEQEVYIKVWKNADKYEERGNFKSWLCTIAKNVSKDYLKSATFKNDCNSTSDEIVLNTIKDNPPQKIGYEVIDYTMNTKTLTKDDMSIIVLKVKDKTKI